MKRKSKSRKTKAAILRELATVRRELATAQSLTPPWESHRPERSHATWTQAEDEALREAFRERGGLTLEDLAVRHRRTVSAIASRAGTLGLCILVFASGGTVHDQIEQARQALEKS